MQYNITYRKKDKGIQFIISYKDSMGKWKQKSKQGFKKQSLAKIAADKALEKLKENSDLQIELNPEYETITFEDFAKMLIEHEKLYKEWNTIIIYKRAFSKFAALNNFKLNDIKSLDIQNCVDKLVHNRFKSSTIKLYLSKLNILFNSAKDKYKIISFSPINNIDVPKDKYYNEKVALTNFELNDLLSKIKNKKYYIISLIAAKSGLRIGEIIGLTWDDVDFKLKTINVRRQWKLIQNGIFGFGDLKSKNSNRTIPVSQTVLNELAKYKNEFPTNFDNRIFSIKNVNDLVGRLCAAYKKYGYNISVHILRHTYATILISNGIDFKTAAKLLGHDVKQTLQTYSHVNSDMLTNAAKIINQVL